MGKVKVLTGAALVLAASVIASTAQAQQGGCEVCKNVGPCAQECQGATSGYNGCFEFDEPLASCPNGVFHGCNWTGGDCGEQEVLLDPTQVTPAGTFLASRTVAVPSSGVLIDPCTGYIVEHEDGGRKHARAEETSLASARVVREVRI